MTLTAAVLACLLAVALLSVPSQWSAAHAHALPSCSDTGGAHAASLLAGAEGDGATHADLACCAGWQCSAPAAALVPATEPLAGIREACRYAAGDRALRGLTPPPRGRPPRLPA